MAENIADWLRGLGLEQYGAAFAVNHIDFEVLRELTAEDLIGLGVGSIGHRRKLLGVIAALRTAPPRGVNSPSGLPATAFEEDLGPGPSGAS